MIVNGIYFIFLCYGNIYILECLVRLKYMLFFLWYMRFMCIELGLENLYKIFLFYLYKEFYIFEI